MRSVLATSQGEARLHTLVIINAHILDVFSQASADIYRSIQCISFGLRYLHPFVFHCICALCYGKSHNLFWLVYMRMVMQSTARGLKNSLLKARGCMFGMRATTPIDRACDF
jgi:hypothetical protein